ncbi:MAG: hypothetical protein R3C44_01110 [Chloroflexota bacterium]
MVKNVEQTGSVQGRLAEAGFLLPNYENGSLANVSPTAAALLDIPFDGLSPLDDSLWKPLHGGVRNVVVLLVDGMGANLLERESALVSRSISNPSLRGEITSIFPPQRLRRSVLYGPGLLRPNMDWSVWNLFLPDLATLMFVLTFSSRTASVPDELLRAGISPETFLRSPGTGQQLTAQALTSTALMPPNCLTRSEPDVCSRCERPDRVGWMGANDGTDPDASGAIPGYQIAADRLLVEG